MLEKKDRKDKKAYIYNKLISNQRIILLCLACMIVFTGGCSKKQESEPGQQVVRVNVGSSLGSGIIYEKTEEQLVIVTAAHILQQGTEMAEITFFDGLTVETDSYFISEHSDAAFINVPLSVIPDGKKNVYVPVKVDKESFDRIQSGASVSLQSALDVSEQQAEYRMGTVLENWIFVEDFDQYMMLLSGNLYPGMSGGGVFDENHSFIGILCGANEKGEIAVLPLNILQAEYASKY